ncbi:MAG: cytochrome c oxidase accessory protein CcoG [Chitinophagaceae bacterium]|nr:cytochrome c oxidase accessory protein CcoG [Chitinophagaceae bacterium]MBL0337365.1 cytochrome c oxidase accessory protein CcoG [Chitinophagaceae bacterium]
MNTTKSRADQLITEDGESFRNQLATVDAKGKRKWIYALKPKGKLYNIRTIVSLVFFGLFFTLPFIKLHGQPLFLFNIPEAEFIIFGKIFWPHDFFIFGIIMITFIVFIVLFTAAFGRLFCGWICPQTVFMEMLFRKLEYLIEGDAPRQRMLKQEGWTAHKIRVKLTKHLVFYLMAFIIANYFLAYIIGADELIKIITEPVGQHTVGFFALLLFSGIFYGVYSYFREQACTVICPYGRLQGVLLDRNSMIVAYDHKRGEPRGKFRKHADESTAHGDCIDCFHCVKVCPTGIDIRNGTQMECVGCTACIDACNEIMDATGKPRGLVRYASENGIEDKKPLRYTGRMKFYTVILIILGTLLTFLLISRKDVDASIVRQTGILYQERGTDSLSNLFNISIENKTINEIPIQLRLEGDQKGKGYVQLIGAEYIHVKKSGMGTGSFFVVLPRSEVHKVKNRIHIGLYQGDKKITEVGTNFMGPFGVR